ncbi:G-protein alpha subunit [Amylocystis lapponica]|nr:G-protein alpha subunit [Amylocystis lapponica]
MRRPRFQPSSPITPEVWPPLPPPGETDLEQALRIEEEKEAKRVSDAIDTAIEQERQELRKQRVNTKILLLGQAESGKSTMLKNFQMHFAPRAFQAEMEAWRTVIHLNLIRSVNFILDLLAGGKSGSMHEGDRRIVPTSPSPGGDDLRRLRMRLSPLRQVEIILTRKLSADEQFRPGEDTHHYGCASEVSIRSGTGWKALLHLKRHALPLDTRPDELGNARQILDACREDIVELWGDPAVQAGLKEEGVVLREQSGFFLDEAARITVLDYEPTFKDVLRARVQTIGVEEYHLTVEVSAERGQRWAFYDVGGARGKGVASWVPYFEDVNAIIFLCPISAFNEVLLEDPDLNRLLDSFNLWQTICASKLLVKATFVLLLNKCDILKAKLDAGVSFARHVKSYKDPNDFEHVSDYLKRKFTTMHKHHMPRTRSLHVHLTVRS